MIKIKVENLNSLNDILRELSVFLNEYDVTGDDVFDSCIVTCELLTNVFRHSGGCATVEWTVQDGFISITVDGGNGKVTTENISLPDVFAESGRGLYIVKSICSGEIETEGGSVKVRLKIHRE